MDAGGFDCLGGDVAHEPVVEGHHRPQVYFPELLRQPELQTHIFVAHQVEFVYLLVELTVCKPVRSDLVLELFLVLEEIFGIGDTK